MFKVLLVEDDFNTSKLMKIMLQNSGFDVICARNGVEALDFMDKKFVDIIVLDVMMPEMDGFELAGLLRQNRNATPILMVTARAGLEDKVFGLETGVDDYMVKPVSEQELAARIKAILRRYKITTEKTLDVGGFHMDYNTHSVYCDGEYQIIPKKEFYLLFKLLSHPGKIFTRIQIMDEIWGMETTSGDLTVNVHINRLRNKFRDNPYFRIVAIKGVGYKAVITADDTQSCEVESDA